jgi:integrase
MNVEQESKSTRAKANKQTFSEAYLRDIDMPEPSKQVVIWDEKQIGLSVLLSGTTKTKTYRATYTISHKNEHLEAGKVKTVKIGRVGEMTLDNARKMVVTYRGIANEGNNPVKDKPRPTTFSEVVAEYVEDYCKPNMRTWDQAERILTSNCAEFANKKIQVLTKPEFKRLCDRFAREGMPYKATVTHMALKRFLKWAEDRGYITANVLIGSTVEYEQRTRDRVYNDDEIKAIWRACDQLDKVEGSYIKLLLLLAPRKTALACTRRSHLDNPDDPKVWTTPFELTKSKKRLRDPRKRRVYVTPLPALAQRIIKGLPKGEGADPFLFPGLKIVESKAGQPIFNTSHLIDRLHKHGAPRDFFPHAVRHTVATWLETQGCSEWERGLVLNHAGSGVTAGYSHGHATKLKLELLEKWAQHVEALVSPAAGVTVLR